MWIDQVLVIGAGAIGSLYAAKLSAQVPVHVIARPDHVSAIARHGLLVTGIESFAAAVTASTSVDRIAPGTLVLLTTKVTDNRGAIEPLAAALSDESVIVCLQNGYGGEQIVRETMSARGRTVLVLRAITQFGAIFRESGVVDYKVAGETLIERHPRSDDITTLFTRCGLRARVTGQIALDVWRKLIFNCVINPITAITGTDVGGITDERLDPLKRLVINECLAVARAEGIAFDVDFMKTIGEVFGASHNIASMRQDLLKRKPTEIDYMNGAIVRLGQQHAIPCPVNAALTAIIKAMEK